MNIYPDVDPEDLGLHYIRHIDRMTVEGLHSKSDIAAQLALRDKEIEELRKENEALLSNYHKTCGLVADMHAAAVGQMIGTKRGLVEDIVDLRNENEALTIERDLNIRQCDAYRADAERYRWLRDLDEDPVLSLAAQYTDMNGSAISISQRIDAAIDAAMKGQP